VRRYFPFFLCVVFGILYVGVFSMPTYCLFKTISGVPCPGCGLTRACAHIAAFRFADAARQNILVVPFALSALAGGVCFSADRVFGKNWLSRLHSALTSKPAVASAAVLALSSWIYNIVIGN